MNTILSFEQGGNALRLYNQNNGYLQLVYSPRVGVTRCLLLVEETLMSDALDMFHRRVATMRDLAETEAVCCVS